VNLASNNQQHVFRRTAEAEACIASLHSRRESRRIMVGSVPVGGGAPISVQSMTNTKTSDVDATLRQIAQLSAAGCDIVRVAVPNQEDAEALPAIVRKSPLPVIADIHFQSKYVFRAIDAGCAAVRVNPGNIRKFKQVGPQICEAAKQAGVSLRIGVNAGSLDSDIYQRYGAPTPQALVESAIREAKLFEDVGFVDFKISVKHHDPVTMIQTYRLLASKGDWPLHLGVTEAGPQWQGTIKSCVAFGALLAEGIGDTIRVSLSAPPVEEAKVGCKILEYLGLRKRHFDLISCPSCGRAQVDVIALANQVADGLKDVTAPLRVAVMGCIVNGPGEAREADLGVASGNGKGQIFIKGEVVETVAEDRIVSTLLQLALDMAESMETKEGDSTDDMVVQHPVVLPIFP
jgi:(E)-4-hydroxy-3-methylbut-2-enyl-diphosphate synthase